MRSAQDKTVCLNRVIVAAAGLSFPVFVLRAVESQDEVRMWYRRNSLPSRLWLHQNARNGNRRRRSRKFRHSEILELRTLLTILPEWTQLSSSTGDLDAPNAGTSQTAALVFDVDGDSIDDFVIAERTSAPAVTWYQSSPDGWTRYVVEDEQLQIEAGGAFHDIDADGDIDIVFGENGGPEMWWWENPAPDFSSPDGWVRRTIKSVSGSQQHDSEFGDVDGDGVTELVTWINSRGELLVVDIPADPQNHSGDWSRSVISTLAGNPEGLDIADVDLDGVDDIVGAGHWFRHTGNGQYDTFVINETVGLDFARTAAGQLIPGGRPEIIVSAGDTVGPMLMYEWDGTDWIETELLSTIVYGHSLELADMNGDGHLDIFTAEMGQPGDKEDADSWIFYGDSTGEFVQQTISVGVGNHESRVGDLDGDGDLDILTKPHRFDAPRIDIFLNEGIPLDRWTRHEIQSELPTRTVFIDTGDFNNDSLPDVVVNGNISWNPGSAGAAWTTTAIGGSINQVALVYDFDEDGDDDILGTEGEGAQANPNLVWARNDGNGTFTVLNNIDVGSGMGDFLQGVTVGRFGPNGTGSLEVALSWHNGAGGVEMLTIPDAPSVDLWTSRNLVTSGQEEALSSGDIDNDGDHDLLLGTRWLRNDQTSWSDVVLNSTAETPDRNKLVDFNGDGRLDALIGFEGPDQIAALAWYEQPFTSPEEEWTEHIIADDLIGPMSVGLVDMDLDGDMDVIVGEHTRDNPDDGRLFVYENLDGQGLQWERFLVHTGDEHHDGAVPVDIDNDGDVDILSTGWRDKQLVLHENLAISPPTGSVTEVIDEDPADNLVLENAVAGTDTGVQGRAETSGMGPIAYRLDNDADGLFAINPASGTVTTSAPLNAEDGITHLITIRATDADGGFNTGTFAIEVADENEFPPDVDSNQTFDVFELSSTGAIVGTPTVTDPDVTQEFSGWKIDSGNTNDVFAIDEFSGRITVADPAQLNRLTTPVYSLGVTVSDGDFTSVEQTVTVNVIPGSPPEFRLFDQNSDDMLVIDADTNLIQSYALNSGNGSPRGAAHDAETGTIWVVDGNDRVYIYGDDGSTLGAWQSKTISRPEGLARHQDDIWIVDRNSRTVSLFAGASSQTDGSLNPTSVFDLHPSNSNPRGMTTDGTSLWIVNDDSSDRVYKYAIDGTYLGDWTIDSNNKAPRGIALDPNDPGDLWIIDIEGDEVFEYADATDRISGSQAAVVRYDTSDYTTLSQAMIRSGPAAPPEPDDPRVSFLRQEASPSSAESLSFAVEFSETVENVDSTDFEILSAGTAAFQSAALNDIDGQWVLTLDQVSGDGDLWLMVSSGNDIVSPDGRSLDLDPLVAETYTVDNSAPLVRVDFLTTSNAQPTLSGTVNDAGALVTVSVNGESYDAANNGDGTWSLSGSTLNSALEPATYDIIATAVDLAGNAATDTTADELTVEPPPPFTTFFYVVDTNSKSSFGYDANFDSDGTFDLQTSHPRGATSDASGQTVWVLDYQSRISVFANDGTKLGEWTADGLRKGDGLATDGQHIWIVDREIDAVFFYADAAARTSGSLGPTSSFSLDSANGLPRGLTTDGNRLWTVDDTTHRVFVYATDGTLLGDWALDSQNTTPRGITIDPSNPNTIWVVDANDKVYEYSNAADLLSGSQTATFVHDVVNTPQGIARAGNGDVPSSGPSVSITRANNNPTTLGSVAFNVQFSENVLNVDLSDFELETTDDINVTQWSLTGSESSYTIFVTGITGDGSLGFSLAPDHDLSNTDGVALDGFTAETYTVDNTSPVVTVDSQTTSDSTPNITGTVSESADIAVTINGQTYSTTSAADGSWSLAGSELQDALDVGIYDIVAVAIDAVGLSGTDLTADELTIEEPPAVSTEFFVVDSKSESTFAYETDGTTSDEFPLNASHPRGAAAVGNTLWVINFESTVFVFDDAGALTGQWQAEGTQKPDGLTTDGQHVWIVDRGLGQILYYENAALRTSGSASVTLSIPLANGNSVPRGITTDGSILWVVDDSANRVFVYDLTGSLLGDWKLAPSNKIPRGITVDPSNGNHIWVVDGGNNRIYRYDNAVDLREGEAEESLTIDLSSDNRQPQGIANP